MKCWDKLTAYVSRLLDIIASRVSPGRMLIVLTALSLLTKLGAAAILDINSLIHPDIDVYVTTAKELADCGMAQTYAGYSYTNPHLFWYAVFLSPVVKCFGDSHKVLTVYLIIISTITLIALYDTVQHRVSYKKAIVFGILYCVLPGQVLLPGYVTHEVAMLFFLSIFIWLLFRVFPAMNHRYIRAVIAVLAIVMLIIAIQMNLAALIAAIALGIILMLSEFNGDVRIKGAKRIIACVVLGIAVVTGGNAFRTVQRMHTDLPATYRETNRFLWVLYVGANTQTKGGWNSQDGDAFAQYEPGSSDREIEAYQRDLLKDRYASLITNGGDLVKLLKDKFLTIWSCFVYPIGYSNETISDPDMRTLYNRFLFKPLVMLEFGLSVILAFCGLISRMRSNAAGDQFQLFLELYMLGVTAMLLLTECNNKYTISLQPVFLAACLSAISSFPQKAEKLRKS